MSQNILFLIALAIFLVVIIYVGIRSKSQVSDADDYILAGRGVGFWMNVVNVMSIGFAGTAITLCAYFSMHFGLFGGMFGNALTAGLYIVYGCLFGTVIRDSGAQTLPEWVEVRYDRKTRNVIAILGIVGMIGILANNIMSIVTITVPIVLPLLVGLGYNEYIVCVLLVFMCDMAGLTPPIGMNVFAVSNALRVSPSEIFAGVTPFFLMDLAAVLIIGAFPEIIMWLPKLTGIA